MLVTTPFMILMVLLLCTLFIVQGPLYASWPNLVDCWFLTRTWSLTLYSRWTRFLFSLALFLFIASCFYILIKCQLASNVKSMMASRPNTNCIGVACVVVWIVDRIAKMTADRIPLQGPSKSNSKLLTWNVRRILLVVWCTHCSMEFVCGFLVVIGWRVIP